MEIRMDGKAALVTGGSRGIGLALARRLAEAGADVLISSRREDGLKAAAAELEGLSGRVELFAAHAGDPEQAEACIDAAISAFGRLDVLVNNAATNPYFGSIMDVDVKMMEKTVQVNQEGLLVWSQLAWRAWMKEHGGAILNVSSVGGLEVEPGIGWYNVTKAAAIHLTKQLAFEMSPSVRVNAIAPGLVKTSFAKVLWEGGRGEAIASWLPLRRIGEPDDIARAGLFLVSDAASWITGEVMVVDGGAMILPGGGIAAAH